MSSFATWLLVVAASSGLSACGGGLAVVESGHRAVLLSPAGNLTVLDEGVADVPVGSAVDDFDLREHQAGGTFVAVTADGVPVTVSDPVVTWGWVADELVDADETLGPTQAPAIVEAIVGAAIGRVLSTYRWDELDTAHIRDAQDRITSAARVALRPRHIALASVDLKGIVPRLSGLAQLVTETSVWQQRSATAMTEVELARRRADNLRAEAAGIVAANAQIDPTLTAAVLADKANRAWQRLLAAPSTTVEVSNVPSPTVEVSP